MRDFSVLMSVYCKDKPECVCQAIDSITTNQTLKPKEIILMVDGPISNDLQSIIRTKALEHNIIRPIWNKENQGLGKVLQRGVLLCSNELVARMDSDDIALSDRFEKQVIFLNETNMNGFRQRE